ncbi:MAG: T9SS type A sorting domain-containing protein, partial [Melioribacteraceae bacterium]|nr:T9SS type A sorting domain-containing protein [Melioribacteraceae bacterium]
SIEYTVPSSEYVTLKVYDILGNEVAELVNEQKQAGTYEVNFNAGNLSSGFYIYKLQAGKFSQVRKMMLLK